MLNNPDIGLPSYIGKVPGSGWIEVSSPGPFKNYRLVVEGLVVPEPNSLVLSILGITFFVVAKKFEGSVPNKVVAIEISGIFTLMEF